MQQKKVKTPFSLAFNQKNWSNILENNEIPVLTNKSEIIKEKGEALNTITTLDTETFSLKCKCIVLKNVSKYWSTFNFCRVHARSKHCVFKYILFKWILKLLKCLICIYLPFIGHELENNSESAPYSSNNLLQIWLVEPKQRGRSPGYFVVSANKHMIDAATYLSADRNKYLHSLTCVHQVNFL